MENRIPFPTSGTIARNPAQLSGSMDFTGVTSIEMCVSSNSSFSAANIEVNIDGVNIGYAWGKQGNTTIKSFPVNYTGVHSITLTRPISQNYDALYTNLSANVPDPIPPTADFSFAFPNTPANPLLTQFTDTSTGDLISSRLWDFGDGQTSTQQSPTHTYATAGTYNVKLTATNPYGSTEITKTVRVPTPPVPNFSQESRGLVVQFTDLSLNSPFSVSADKLTVTCTDTSQNSPSSWLWNFGDGNTSTEKSPVHTYAAPGLYVITLTSTNTAGASTATKTVTLQNAVAPTPPSGSISPSSVTTGTKQMTLKGTGNSVVIYKSNGATVTYTDAIEVAA